MEGGERMESEGELLVGWIDVGMDGGMVGGKLWSEGVRWDQCRTKLAMVSNFFFTAPPL